MSASGGLILVVDDDEALAATVSAILEGEGYQVRTARDAFQAEGLAARWEPDLVVLDRQLGRVDGLELCRRLRADPRRARLPVLFLSKKGSPAERVAGLAAGADDYLAKPFSHEELVLRIQALLRRARPPEPEERTLRSEEVSLDLAAGKASVRGKPVALTPLELDLLRAFLECRGRILSRRFLLERVWGPERSLDVGSRAVDVAVSGLRSKLGPSGGRLVAVTRQGYRFDPA